MTATRTSTASAESGRGGEARPRIGLLGIMQALYDEMLPGITERQAAYAQELADALAGEADVVVAPPARDRDDIERTVRSFEGLDGLLVVMLTYGPAMRVARALADTRLPVCLVNVQPEGEVTAAWDMADLTYNQGIHGAQDTANAMVRAGRPFHVITDDWRSPSFASSVGVWARAAAAVTRWRSLRVGVFGYAMNGMGDIRVDEHTLLRVLGPEVVSLAPGELTRVAVSDDDIAAVIAFEDGQFEIDPRLSREERADHARMQVAIARVLDAAGCRAYSTHFGAIAEDGRFSRLPLAAASSLMAAGYGFGAEGDALTAALDERRPRAARRDAVHRDVRDGLPQRLDPDVAHGRGQLEAREARPARPPDQAALGDRRARRSADVPVPVRARPGDARHPGGARRHGSGSWSARARCSSATSCRTSRCRTGSSGRRRACASA